MIRELVPREDRMLRTETLSLRELEERRDEAEAEVYRLTAELKVARGVLISTSAAVEKLREEVRR